MKRIILCLCLFIFIRSEAQQINPVPDYVFSNKMSVGRNAVTDTAAYFSIGPRYGAIRGMMPPMVTDTASMSATKRNGLLIFSIQKNKYLYWDSVGSKWAEMAGTAGSAITGSGVAGYMPEFTTSTNIDTTRLYHSAGRFAIGSTTTTNGVFNVYSGQSYMDSTLKIGNGELIVGSTSSASRKLYVTSNSDVARFEQTASDKNMVIELRHTNPNASGTIREEGINFLSPNTSTRGRITFYPSDTFNVRNYLAFFTPSGSGTNAERLRIANDGEVLIGTTSDAGVYALQVQGAMYATGNLNFAGGDISISNISNNVLAFGTNNTERMRIGANGDVAIGTTNADPFARGDDRRIAMDASGISSTANVALSLNAGSSAGRGAQLYLGVGGTRHFEISSNSVEQGISAISNTYIKFLTNNTERMRLKADGEVLIGTTSDAGAYALQVSGAIYNTTTITTGAPTGGSIKPWRLGEAATVSPTSPNRTIRVEIDGTVYYIHAKTTND